MKKEKKIALKTKRLILSPMSDSELEDLIANTQDEELKQAYGEMLEGCKEDASNRLWYTAWKISLKENGQFIGDICFKGPVKCYSVEIGYGIHKEFEGNGYTTEAVKVLMEWAFFQKDVYFIEAETAPDNLASQKVLEKNGFVKEGEGEEGPRFVREKDKSYWMSIYMCFGLSIGLCFNQSGTGMCLGMCIGMAIGVIMDSKEKQEQEKRREDRKNHLNS